MIAINPLDITEGAFTSTVPEPDAARGEVEWVDREKIRIDGNLSGTYTGVEESITSIGSVIYTSIFNQIVEYDTTTKVSTDTATLPARYGNIIGANNGNVYLCEDGLAVGFYDTSLKTFSTIGSAANGDSKVLIDNGNGYIYGFGGAGGITRVSTDSNSVSKLSSNDVSGFSFAEVGSDGYIYIFKTSGAISRYNPETDSLTSVSDDPLPIIGTTKNEDGSILFAASWNAMISISISNGAVNVSTFKTVEFPAGTCIFQSGYVYLLGYGGDGAEKNTAIVNISDRTSKYVPTDDARLFTSATVIGGAIYSLGYSSITAHRHTVCAIDEYYYDEDVIASSEHRRYRAALSTKDNPVDGVLKVPPTWIDIGPTNKYAMFDDEVQTATIGASPMVITSTPGIIANGLAMFNVSGASNINVTVNSAASGEVYNKDIDMNNSTNVTDAWTYYFTPIIRIDRFVLLDIPPYSDATITVTLTGVGDISAGVLALGPQISIGVANYNTEIQLLDFSTRERDTFGNFKTVKRAIADLVKFDVTIPKANVSYVRNQFKLLSQVPTVWVGGGGGVDDPTLVYGYYENFVNNISSPSITKSTITIQGVV